MRTISGFKRLLMLAIVTLAMAVGSTYGSDEPLRFATLTSISKAPPAVVAEEKKYFDKEGVKVETKLFNSGKSAVQALASGQFDIAMIGDIPALALLGQGYPGKIIAAGLGGPKRQALLVKTDSSYRSIEDLKGKRVGLTKGSTDDIALEATFSKNGMTWSDIQVINLRPPAKASALQTGEVDAVEAWEPVPSVIVTKGIGRRLLTADGDISDIVGVIIASDDILRERPEDIQKFLRAIHEGARYAQDNADEMVELLSEKLRVEKDVLVEAIPTQWWYIDVYSDTVANWKTSVDLLKRLDRLSKDFDVESVVDVSYLSKATGLEYPLAKSAPEAMSYPKLSAAR